MTTKEKYKSNRFIYKSKDTSEITKEMTRDVEIETKRKRIS